jgi:hypothetical protein
MESAHYVHEEDLGWTLDGCYGRRPRDHARNASFWTGLLCISCPCPAGFSNNPSKSPLVIVRIVG